MFRGFLLLLLFAGEAEARPWFDESHAVFFPDRVRDQILAPQSFPVFWWSFLVLSTANTEVARKVCDRLKASTVEISRAECRPRIDEVLPLLKEWALDVPLRIPKPDAANLRR
jgi:hypothetical protein